MEIVIRAKEAQRAAMELRNAEARARAAQMAWDKKMREAREEARSEQKRIRI